MEKTVIVAAKRTPVGKFNGMLSDVLPRTLGATVIKALMQETKISLDLIDEVIFGEVLTAGVGQNPARQAAMDAGLSNTVPCFTLNKVCGSGLKAIALAANAIKAQDGEIFVAGGQENMDLAPHLLLGSRKGKRLGIWEMVDSMISDGLSDSFYYCHMGATAENIAEKYNISRESQDEFAFLSQMKAKKAIEEGKFKDEIIPVLVNQGKNKQLLFDVDEHPRFDTTKEKLAQLVPAFVKGGTVTAGNSSGINSGAAAVILTTEKKAKELKLKPLATVVAYNSVGLDPKMMGMGPVEASKRCLKKANWNVSDLDLIEVNEAFAVQVIAINQVMNWDPNKVNVNGGAIALGHPLGASGARILVTLVYEMIKRNARKALATLCIGGGMGIAMALERE